MSQITSAGGKFHLLEEGGAQFQSLGSLVPHLTAYLRGSTHDINRRGAYSAPCPDLDPLGLGSPSPGSLCKISCESLTAPTMCPHQHQARSRGFGNELELLPGRSSPYGGRDWPVKRECAPQIFDGKLPPSLFALTLCKTLLKTFMPKRPLQSSRNFSSER